MRVVLAKSLDEAVFKVAEVFVERIQSQPSSVIGLATGKTMIPVYRKWVELAYERKVDHSKAFFFMLDEYLGLPEGHKALFKTFIRKHLGEPLGLRPDHLVIPDAYHSSVEQAAQSYERLIREAGGIDMQLLGIGQNGHIGFNEPGSSVHSRTRKVELAQDTIKANHAELNGTNVKEAITMGLASIMEAKSLWLLATGQSKATVIKFLLNHHDEPSCPATFLKSHSHLTLVLDPEASAKINLNV